MMEIGKSNAKIYMEQDTRVTFDDVAGVDEAKEELQEAVTFLRLRRTVPAAVPGINFLSGGQSKQMVGYQRA